MKRWFNTPLKMKPRRIKEMAKTGGIGNVYQPPEMKIKES